MAGDWELETLLTMDGEIGDAGGGLWWKIEVRRVAPSPFRPHGIRYSLTLHDRDNRRILGIDNAHGLAKQGRSPGRRRRAAFDHRHHGRSVADYAYRSAPDLLADFFDMVDAERRRRGLT